MVFWNYSATDSHRWTQIGLNTKKSQIVFLEVFMKDLYMIIKEKISGNQRRSVAK